jgi:ribosomal protein L37E
VRKWYADIKRYECRECGAELGTYDIILKACPSCGWTDKKQTAFDKGYEDPPSKKRKTP